MSVYRLPQCNLPRQMAYRQMKTATKFTGELPIAKVTVVTRPAVLASKLEANPLLTSIVMSEMLPESRHPRVRLWVGRVLRAGDRQAD
jgi:hypothetical protein